MNKKNIFIYDLLWIFLGILSITSIFLITFGWFLPLLSLAISAVLFLLTIFVFRNKVDFKVKDNRWDKWIILIVLFALVLRIQPWPYLEGGQDEGLYMSLSSQFDSSKGLHFEDIAQKYIDPKIEDKYNKPKGWFVLGIKKEDDSSKLYYDFYPLHPLLMSVTGAVLGDANRVYSLTFFSILSIAGAYLLTSELSKNKKAGYIAAGILAVSPLHLYFSRFPVTEILALAITLNFLYYLLVAYREKNYNLLWISIILVNMFLYLRLTWVVALPFCYLTLLTILIYSKDNKEKKNWSIWGLLMLISYGISLFFYRINYNFIFMHFYDEVFNLIPETFYYILLAALPLITFGLVKYLKDYIKAILNFVYKHRLLILWLSLIAAGLYGVYMFYRVAFSTEFVGTSLDRIWGLANAGWYSIKDQVLVSIILHLSPFAFLVLLFSLKRINSPEKLLLFFFAFTFLVFNMVIIRYTPYQIYYARYQLSEIIPVALIFTSIFLVEMLKEKKILKILAWIFLVLIFAYNIFFSLYQYQGYVGTTPSFFKELAKTVSKEKDFIVYYDPTDWSKSFLFSPLKYYYNFPAVQTSREDLLELFTNSVSDYSKAKVYVLSTIELDDGKYKYIKSIKYQRGFYSNAIEAMPPLTWKVNDNTIPFCTLVIPYKYCGGLIPIKYHLGSIDIKIYEYIP